jgi:hypothetical protein
MTTSTKGRMKMTMQYQLDEDVVVVSECSPTYTTYTRGTMDYLYRGESEDEARESLGLTWLKWQSLLWTDPVEETSCSDLF